MNAGEPACGYEIFRDEDQSFAFDIKSSRLFAIHNVLADVLQAEAKGDRNLDRLACVHGADALRRARHELAQVRAVGLLPFTSPRDDDLTILRKSSYCQATIFLTDRCNMRCRYCYEGYQGLRREGGSTMEWLPLRWSLDYVFRVFGAGCDIFDIHFFGGEPLLEFELIRQATDYCRHLGQQHHLEVNLSISTNGLLLTPEMLAFLRDHTFDVSVSLDGPPPVHDRARQLPSGVGSYERLEPKLDALLATEGLYVELAGVLSPVNTDVFNSFLWAYEKGGRAISFIIPKLRYSHPMAVKERDLELIKRSYTELANYLLERMIAHDFGPLASLIAANDYLGRFIKRVFSREHLSYRCRAGKDMLAIGADGRVYPCLGFVGMREWVMGTTRSLPDERIGDMFCDQHVDRKASCQGCWGRYLCGGGCYAHAAMSNARIDKPDPQDCELTRHLMRLAVMVVGRLQHEYPDVLPQFFSALLRSVPAKHYKFVPPLLRQYLAEPPDSSEKQTQARTLDQEEALAP